MRNKELDNKKKQIDEKTQIAEEKTSELQTVNSVTYMEFMYDILENNNDALVLVHDPYTEIDVTVYTILEKVNQILRDKLNINTLRVYSYDITKTRLHTYFYNLGNFKINSFYLLRGNRNDNLVLSSKGVTGAEVMRFFLEGALTKFKISRGDLSFDSDEEALGFTFDGIFNHAKRSDQTDL